MGLHGKCAENVDYDEKEFLVERGVEHTLDGTDITQLDVGIAMVCPLYTPDAADE